jgi:O-antigen ligase
MTAAPSYTPPALQDSEPTPLLKLSFYCFCLFNLAYYSRFFEWKFAFLHVPLVTSCIALLGASMEGRLVATVQSKIGACMAALTVLYALNVPLSTWRGESFRIFTENWLKAVVAFLIAGALIATFAQCRVALNSIGWGAAIASLLANFTGTSQEGRLVAGTGTLGNANELAFILLLGLPLVWLMVTDSQAPKPKRLLALAMTVSMVYALLRTGSRAGFIGVCLLVFLQFLRASLPAKAAIVLGAAILGTWLFLSFPKVMERYKTMFSGADVIAEARNRQEAMEIGSAIESAQTRRKLLTNSLWVTKQRPFLGVGLGAFGSYMASAEKEEGINPHYQGTHNSYTQVSSEAGVPALLCFLGVIVFSFQGLRKLYKRARRSPAPAAKQIANVSFALIATLTAYSVCVFFDYAAYDATLPVLAGFAVALAAAGNSALDTAEKTPQVLVRQPDPWAPEFNARRRYPVRPAV